MAVLNFKGKTFVQNHHLAVAYHQLVPDKKKSLTDSVSLNDNLIIHGDNLKALKALLPTYAGKVKCIYIDPPYNTGNEKWVYNDNVNSPMMQEWLGKVVDKEDLTRHDKWLCMMMPRLKLLRELLSNDGMIFVNIDDNEVHHLKMLLDDIFGEDRFIGTIAWKKTSGDNKPSFAFTHDNIIIYGKCINELPRTELSKEQKKQYSNPDNDPRGDWAETDYRSKWNKQERPNLYYAIINPHTKQKIFPDTFSSSKRVWGCSYETHLENEKNGLVYWGENKNSKEPKKKRFLSEHEGTNTRSVWLDAGSNDEASQQLKDLGIDFDNPKPVTLIKRIIRIATDDSSIILDSFAGSGTTAHAVLEVNGEEADSSRKFILIETEDYADKITAERVRRVIKGIKTSKDEKLQKGLGGSFSYFELGDPIEMESILEGAKLPSYLDLARYVFYTATGEEFKSKAVDEKSHFIGETKDYEVYLFYQPKIDYLKSTAFTLDDAKKFGPVKKKKRIVFAPAKYIDNDYLADYRIEFCQLPFEIYRIRGK